MIDVDPRGVRLLTCSNCFTHKYVEVNVDSCPTCGVAHVTREVICASIEHNDGCDNPDCWKYTERERNK